MGKSNSIIGWSIIIAKLNWHVAIMHIAYLAGNCTYAIACFKNHAHKTSTRYIIRNLSIHYNGDENG